MQGYDFGIGSKREKIMREKTAVQTFIELSKKMNEMMYLLTRYELKQGQQKYEPIHIDNSEKHRAEIARELTPNEVIILENDLDVLGEALSSLLDILQKEGAKEE
jgi:hypothetical protein